MSQKSIKKITLIPNKERVHEAFGISDERVKELQNLSIDLVLKTKGPAETIQAVADLCETDNEILFCAFAIGSVVT